MAMVFGTRPTLAVCENQRPGVMPPCLHGRDSTYGKTSAVGCCPCPAVAFARLHKNSMLLMHCPILRCI